MDWRIIDGFSFRGSFGFTAQYDRNDKYQPSTLTAFDGYTGEKIARRGSYTYGSGNSFSYTFRGTLDYVKQLDKHQLSAGVSVSFDESKGEKYSFTVEGIQNPNMFHVSD